MLVFSIDVVFKLKSLYLGSMDALRLFNVSMVSLQMAHPVKRHVVNNVVSEHLPVIASPALFAKMDTVAWEIKHVMVPTSDQFLNHAMVAVHA